MKNIAKNMERHFGIAMLSVAFLLVSTVSSLAAGLDLDTGINRLRWGEPYHEVQWQYQLSGLRTESLGPRKGIVAYCEAVASRPAEERFYDFQVDHYKLIFPHGYLHTIRVFTEPYQYTDEDYARVRQEIQSDFQSYYQVEPKTARTTEGKRDMVSLTWETENKGKGTVYIVTTYTGKGQKIFLVVAEISH